MSDSRNFARFLTWSALVTATGTLLVMLFVVVVDPYRLFGLVNVAGFNRVKPSPEQYQEQIKVAQAGGLRANTLFLGNSRTEVGLNPENLDLAAGGYSAYNLALSGTGIATARREFDSVRQKAKAPALVVLGVEFLDFLLDPAAVPPAAPPATPPERHANDLRWRFDTLFSLASTLDAVKTLRIQHNPEAETMTARGFNPLLEYRKHAREEGYFSLFQQRATEYAKSLVRKPHGLVMPATGGSEDLAALNEFLSTLAEDKTEVHLIIYPYHAQILAMLEQTGLWPSFQEWKGLLVREVDAVRLRHPGARIVLWDFSGFSAIHCERIPARGDTKTSTQWYWEAGHFKSALGDLILGRILTEPDHRVPAGGIGFVLGAATLEQNRLRVEAERRSCAATYPELFGDAARLVAGAQARRR